MPVEGVYWRGGLTGPPTKQRTPLSPLSAAERQQIENMRVDIAKLTEREKTASRRDAELRELLRETKGEIIGKVDEVEGECVGFRKTAERRWEQEDERRRARVKERGRAEAEDVTSKRSVTAAWILGSLGFLGIIAQTAATLLGH